MIRSVSLSKMFTSLISPHKVIKVTTAFKAASRLMTNFKINVDIKKSLPALTDAKMILYAFKGINSRERNVVSTVWFKVNALIATIPVEWNDTYDVYINQQTSIEEDTDMTAGLSQLTIDAGCIAVMKGNHFDVDNDSGITATPKFYTLLNNDKQPHTCGLAAANSNQKDSPICATILHGQCAVKIEPNEKLFLAFSTEEYDEGTVVTEFDSPGYLIQVKADSTPSGAIVTYDIDNSWSCADNSVTCTIVPALHTFVQDLNQFVGKSKTSSP